MEQKKGFAIFLSLIIAVGVASPVFSYYLIFQQENFYTSEINELKKQIFDLNIALEKQASTDRVLEGRIANLAPLMPDGKYDNTGVFVSPEEIARVKDSIVVLAYRVKDAIKLENGTRIDANWFAFGVVVNWQGKEYLLSLYSNAFNPYSYEEGQSNFSAEVFFYNPQQKNFERLAVSLGVWAYNTLIFSVPPQLKGKGVSLGKSSELENGNYVMLVNSVVKPGVISRANASSILDDWLKYFQFDSLSLTDLSEISATVLLQELGSPVFASRDGKLELIGILMRVNTYLQYSPSAPEELKSLIVSQEGMGTILKIDAIKDVFRRFYSSIS